MRTEVYNVDGLSPDKVDIALQQQPPLITYFLRAQKTCSKTCTASSGCTAIHQVGSKSSSFWSKEMEAKSFSTFASKHPTYCDSARHSRHSDLAELEFFPSLEHRFLLLSPLLWGSCLSNGHYSLEDLSNSAVNHVEMMPTHLPSQWI